MTTVNNVPDFSKYKFHCSDLGDLMTDPRTKGEFLSETAKKKLVEIFVTETYGRTKDVTSKYLEKGLAVEEDSITLYSRVKKKIYFKNDYRLYNEFLSGEPDLFDGPEIKKASLIVDTKSSWDIFTFYAAKMAVINKAYFYQLNGYLALTGAPRAILAYCLVNTPEALLEAEHKKLWYQLGQPGGTDQNYVDGCQAIDRAGKFDDVPMSERVHEQEIFRNSNVEAAIYERLVKCRAWLMAFQADPELMEQLVGQLASELAAKLVVK